METAIIPTVVTTEIVPYVDVRAQLVALEAENARTRFDYATPAGEKAARSHIWKLRQARGKLEAERKKLKAEALEWGRKVDGGARELDARIEAMIAIHQAPLDAAAALEAERVARIETAVQAIRAPRASVPPGAASDVVAAALAAVEAIKIGVEYQERMAEAMTLWATELDALRAALVEVKAREDAAAEAERIRREAEAKARAEREQRIADEAAAQAKAEAEAKAAREAAEAEARARREREAVEAAARAAAEESARKVREAEARAEADRQAAAKREREAAEKAAREKADAERRAEQERQAAARRERELVESAAREKAASEAAVKRAQEEADRRVREAEEAAARKAAAEAAEQAKREANRKHVAGTNRAAASAIRVIVEAGGEEIAENIVRAIVAGKIPAVSIRY